MAERRTALYDLHVAGKARMVPFAGWSMPLNYGSQLAEHRDVRGAAGMFDVSHMTITDLAGADARELLDRLFANDVGKAVPGRAVYGVLLNASGGIIDDVIVYGRDPGYRVVSNAATRDKVLDWLRVHAADLDVDLREREDLALIAVQGPNAMSAFCGATSMDVSDLRPFSVRERNGWMVARTGYTGEDGVEVALPDDQAGTLWQRLSDAGVACAGLGARDTLRLEAGLLLYGEDMDEATSPLESNLGWTVAWDPPERDFVGREALARQRSRGPERVLRGVVLAGRGVIRHGQRVETNAGAGIVTSGIFSPTLGYSIGFARVPRGATGNCLIEIRGSDIPGRIVRPPFVRQGKQVFK
ncbi:MAG: glycine cleavage system aminomethyltransferase GcvT [Gammaproteobacteria bacterium]|nr:glycine cleavage system aminomethyltransferase GcvT [Gammaproteobacteria bacterium]